MSTTKEAFEDAIEKLRTGQLQQLYVQKEDFLLFREVLMAQKDKKNIVGEAKKGGNVIYRYISD